MSEKKRIGNEQPLPIDIIKDAIIEYLETKEINKDNLSLKIKERIKGENRAKKTCNAVYSTITKSSPLNKALLKNFTAETFYKLSDNDKNIIVMSLICLRFPFNYDFLLSFAKLFTVQDTVNKQYINEKMAAIYGSNLSLEHGIAAALTMAIDCKFLKRESPGLFSKSELLTKTDFAKEAWIYTFFEMNGRKAVVIDDLKYEPIMMYVIDTSVNWKNSKILETTEDYSNQVIINKLK